MILNKRLLAKSNFRFMRPLDSSYPIHIMRSEQPAVTDNIEQMEIAVVYMFEEKEKCSSLKHVYETNAV